MKPLFLMLVVFLPFQRGIAQNQLFWAAEYWRASPQWTGPAFESIEFDALDALGMQVEVGIGRLRMGATARFAPTVWRFKAPVLKARGSWGGVEGILGYRISTWAELRVHGRVFLSVSPDELLTKERVQQAVEPLPSFFRYRSTLLGPGLALKLPLIRRRYFLTLSGVYYFGQNRWQLHYETAPQSTLLIPDTDEKYSDERTVVEVGVGRAWSSGFMIWAGYCFENSTVKNGESRLGGPRITLSITAR